MKCPAIAALALVALVAAAPEARAQGIGFQGGVAVDPTQGYVGTHFESPAFADRVHFRPSIDGAFGSGVSAAIINVFFLYKLPLNPASPWALLSGTGPVVTLLRINGDVQAHGGLGGMFGIAHRSGAFAEFVVSGAEGPSVRFGAGYTVRFGQP
jgi:hypothetical protein